MTQDVLRIEDLRLSFKGYTGLTEVLHGISINIARGERVALVGESGSGKSVTARIVLGSVQELRTSRITGRVEFDGVELNTMSAAERHALRGTRISMIFQDPTSSLNPVFTIGDQFHDVLRRVNPKISRADAFAKASKMLREVSIEDGERVLNAFPFQLSGGMNQRVMIAMALANEPELLIADEPGTALDVTVQAQTLDLMKHLVENHHTAVLFISHNLGVVREFADRLYVIYKGRIVEHGRTDAVFANPRHPYTKALLSAVPKLTGGGIPSIEEVSADYTAPMEVHDEEWAHG